MLGKLASGMAVFVLTFCFLQVHLIFISLISAYDDDDFSEPTKMDSHSVSDMFKNAENTCTGSDCSDNVSDVPICSDSEFLDEKLGICLKIKQDIVLGVGSEMELEAETNQKNNQKSELKNTSQNNQETESQVESTSTKSELDRDNKLKIDENGESEILQETTSETVLTDEKPSEIMTEEDDSLTTEEIQRLAAAFVFCIIGTLASRGNLIWTAVLYAYLFAMFYWWAYDKHDDIIDSFVKVKTVSDERNAEKQRQRSGGYYYKTEPPIQPHQ